jgi:hypothetical protein
MAGEYRFSFGPWNIHEGADPFGPTVRDGVQFGKKLKMSHQGAIDIHNKAMDFLREKIKSKHCCDFV